MVEACHIRRLFRRFVTLRAAPGIQGRSSRQPQQEMPPPGGHTNLLHSWLGQNAPPQQPASARSSYPGVRAPLAIKGKICRCMSAIGWSPTSPAGQLRPFNTRISWGVSGHWPPTCVGCLTATSRSRMFFANPARGVRQGHSLHRSTAGACCDSEHWLCRIRRARLCLSGRVDQAGGRKNVFDEECIKVYEILTLAPQSWLRPDCMIGGPHPYSRQPCCFVRRSCRARSSGKEPIRVLRSSRVAC